MDMNGVRQAIQTYFSSEAAEMYCILAGSAVFALLAALLWASLRDRFSVSLAITLAFLAFALAATGAGLLVRDTANRNQLLAVIDGGDRVAADQALAIETERLQAVVDNYPNLRWMFAAFALLGAVAIAAGKSGPLHAAAVGFLIFAAAGVVIDQYSEKRAVAYLEQLSAKANVPERSR